MKNIKNNLDILFDGIGHVLLVVNLNWINIDVIGVNYVTVGMAVGSAIMVVTWIIDMYTSYWKH